MVQRLYSIICGCLVALIATSAFAYDIDIGVTTSTDDCEESNAGAVNTSGASITLDSLRWGAGIRFQSISIPQGATIDVAYIVMTGSYSCGVNGCNTTIYGADADDTSTWSAFNKPSNVTQTTASTSFNLTGTFAPDLQYYTWTKDITTIVQEIVDRGGWSSGNDMSLVIDGDSWVGRGSGFSINAYDHLSNPEPKLKVNYTAGGSVRRIINVD